MSWGSRKKWTLIAVILLISILAVPAGFFLSDKISQRDGNENPNITPTPSPTLKENFLNFAAIHNITRSAADNFYGNHSNFVQSLFKRDTSLLLPPLRLYEKNLTIFGELLRNISLDPRVTMDSDYLASLVSQQFWDLGYYGKVKVLSPETNEYREEFLTKYTVQAVVNCTLAIYQRSYPSLSKEAWFVLGNATQLNSEIGNFEKTVIIERDRDQVDLWMDYDKTDFNYYTLAMDLQQSPYVLSKPESFEFFNGLLRQHNYVLNLLNLDSVDQTTRQTYIKPDIDYYYLFLPNKSIPRGTVIYDYHKVQNGTYTNVDPNGTIEYEPSYDFVQYELLTLDETVQFPLLPLLNLTKMTEWFPEKTDRAVIYASQYPVELLYFNAKTGEYADSSVQGWAALYGSKTLLDNLGLVWNGGEMGRI